MATYTPNYGLHQWEGGDNFLRTDFNEDLQKIDAALGEKAEISRGIYTGNGLATQSINLGFQPAVVYVCTSTGLINTGKMNYGGLALYGHPLTQYQDGEYPALVLTDHGFTVYYTKISASDFVNTNAANTNYYYIAVHI